MDEPACPGCRELLQRVAELEARVAELIHWRNGYVPGTWDDNQLDAHRVSFD